MAAQGAGSRAGAIEGFLLRDQVIAAAAATVLVVRSGLNTFFGIGMNMTAIEMTQMTHPIGDSILVPMAPMSTATRAVLIFLIRRGHSNVAVTVPMQLRNNRRDKPAREPASGGKRQPALTPPAGFG